MSRPKGLTLTAVLMVFCGVMALATITPGRPHSGRLLGILTLWLCIALFIIWVYWNGRSWARSAVLAFSGACILNLYAWNRVPLIHSVLTTPTQTLMAARAILGAALFVLFEHASGPRFLLSGEQTSSIGDTEHQAARACLSPETLTKNKVVSTQNPASTSMSEIDMLRQ